MPQDHTIRGVPMTLQRDSWWLTDAPPGQNPITRAKGPVLALIALLLLGDQLFWHHPPGLSLALFAVAIFAATANRTTPLSATLLTLSVLPVIEYVQPLSLVILGLGLPTAIALNRGLAPLPALVALVRRLPLAMPGALATGVRHLPGAQSRSLLRNWGFPLGGMLVLLSLLAQANPVLAGWIAVLTTLPLDPVDLALRALFWAGLALILWPLLTQTPSAALTLTLPRLTTGLNATSVTNALVLFNAVLALQLGLDALYLFGTTTPPGMTLATYAHRGAYPLLATALLAGAFALAARPWLAEKPRLTPLLLLWLGQNVVLTLSALYRLHLYVQSFGLTYLRVDAAIWLGLVAAGLALTAVQIALHRPNRWLLLQCTVLAVATLYACAFLNFAAAIARVNLAQDKIDAQYLCDLGPTAAAELAHAPYWVVSHCPNSQPQILGWRDWGFRNWRVRRYLDQHMPERPLEDSRRG